MADDTQVTNQDQQTETPEVQEAEADSGQKDEKAFTQEQVDQIVAERLKRKEKQAEAEKEKAQAEAREQTLKEQEDYKGLVEEYKGTISKKDEQIAELQEIETAVNLANERVETLETLASGLIKPQLELVDELYRPFVEKMPVEEQAQWLIDNAEKLSGSQVPRPAGSRPTGRAERPPKAEADKSAREGQKSARVSAI